MTDTKEAANPLREALDAAELHIGELMQGMDDKEAEIDFLNEKLATSDTHMGELMAELATVKANNAELCNDLENAIDSINVWGGMCSDFMREKYDLEGELAIYRAALSKAKGEQP